MPWNCKPAQFTYLISQDQDFFYCFSKLNAIAGFKFDVDNIVSFIDL